MPAPRLAFTSIPSLSFIIPEFVTGTEAEAIEQGLLQRISERARLLFEQSGNEPGNDEANWLRAESEILGPSLDVRESAMWIMVDASLPNASGRGMQIAVGPSRIVVYDRRTDNTSDSLESANDGEGEILAAANLPAEVDPSSAAASFRDHRLRLVMKKR